MTPGGLCLENPDVCLLPVVQEVARCQATDARLSLAQVCATYRGLQAGYREEYVLYSLASAALAQVCLFPPG